MRDDKPYKTPAKPAAGRQERRPDGSRKAKSGGRLVKVYARAGTPGHNNWCLLLKFTDGAGHPQTKRIPASQVRDKNQLVNFLVSYGVPVPAESDEMVRSIQQAQPKRFVRLVHRPGWHSDQFLFGNDSSRKSNGS